MDYIKRDIESTILEVSKSYASIIITGPRQVGKSTTLRRISENNRTEVTMDDLEARRLAKTDPELFLGGMLSDDRLFFLVVGVGVLQNIHTT